MDIRHSGHRVSPLGLVTLSLTVILSACTRSAAEPESADSSATPLTGLVFEDANGNGIRDEKEKGLARVRVSNGRDVVMTDVRGRWFLEARPDDTIFVIKPPNWMPALDENGLPRFFYVHRPAGSPPDLKYPGIAPTPEDPGVILFPMYRHPEAGPFTVILLGDPQSRNLREVDYLAQDIIEPLLQTEADFGVCLGDLAFDDLSILPVQNAVIGRTGLPWFNVHGNHDLNFDVEDDSDSDETWQRLYGPATYSFDWGTAHFIVIDNVIYEGEGSYRGGFTPDVLSFIESDLKQIGKETLVVLLMHIPLTGTDNADDLLRLIADRPNTLSVAAHYHQQAHLFLPFPEDTGRREPHHHLINATACGSWWQGEPDEYGIPHAMMRCGAPNGHTELTIKDFDYTLSFRPAGRDPDQQMHLFLPGAIDADALGTTEVVANVWAGSPRSITRMRVDGGPWIEMRRDRRPDPFLEMAVVTERLHGTPRGRPLSEPVDSAHLWVGGLPETLRPGAHVLEVESTDMFGRIHTGHRIFRVLGGPDP